VAECRAVSGFDDPNQCLMLATRSGVVKKTPLEEYRRRRTKGLIAVKLREGDELVDAVITKPGDELVLATAKGMAIRFPESDARPMGRDTSGVRGIKLGAGDRLVGMVVADPDATLLTVCEQGYGKRTPFGAGTPIAGAAPGEEGEAPEAEAVLEAALFDGAAPVLLLPGTLLPETLGKRVVIAWNQGREAMAAVRRALPLLRKADLVNIVVVDPPAYGPERSDPGGALCQMLVRHGVKAEVSVLARTMPRVSDVLVRHIRDQNADILVMGAYGHSRFREAILGGATRDMLELAQVPVFLAH
jgi:nucleotide-binding universal stress UspA family protein